MSFITDEIYTSDSSSSANPSHSLSLEDSLAEDNRSDVVFPELLEYRKKYTRQFIFAHININGFRLKYHEIHEVLLNGYVDFLAVSETKIDQSFSSSQFHVRDFTLYRADRNSRGGGILCYVSSRIPHRRRNDILSSSSLVEHIVIELKVREQTLIIAALYRPPNVSMQNLRNAIEQICCTCLSMNCTFYLIGDLNVDFSNSSHNLVDLLSLYDIQNVVRNPTCFKSANPSLIDVILTNTPRKLNPCLNINIGLSDCHNYIGAATKMHVARNCNRKIVYRSYKRFNVEAYQSDLRAAPFHVSCVFDDPDDAMWAHNNLLYSILNYHAPLKSKIARRKSLSCMNGELRRAINVKAMLRRKFDRNRNDGAAWERYRKQRNLVNRMKVQSIKKYFDDRCTPIANGNGREFWDTIRPFISDSKSSASEVSLVEGDRAVNHPRDVAEILNEHFVNTVTRNSENLDVREMSIEEIAEHYDNHSSVYIIKQIMSTRHIDAMHFSEVTQSDVKKKLVKLKTDKAAGYDMIPAKLLKLGADQISRSLTPIINMCITSSCFPDNLKLAEVSPAFKKLDRTDKKNYRPISVLVSMSKVFEGILCDQLMTHFNDILSTKLSAYRKTYSCCNVVLQCIEDWRKALDNNEMVGCILMDLSKAFDSLPHGLLLTKLHSYGLDVASCQLIRSYLTNRWQRVKIGSERSSWRRLQHGVPQGSLTGPLLFNVFLNDLLHKLSDSCIVYNYADDNSLSFHHENPGVVKSVLETASMDAIHWFCDNFMLANPDKFQAIILSRDASITISQFEIGGAIIHPSKEIKMLGFTVDDKLSFKSHVQKICTKAARQVNAFQRVSRFLCFENKLSIYECFIKANFNYGPFIYHFTGKTEARMLENVNERALRLVFNDFTTPYAQFYDKYKKESLYDQRTKHVIKMVFKIIAGEAPPMSADFFVFNNVPYNLRDPMLLQHMYKTKFYGFNSLRIAGASMWNKLPSSLKLCMSEATLKESLRSHVFTCQCGTCFKCTL